MKYFNYRTLALLGLLALGCDEAEVIQTSSLNGPRSTVVVRGEVCIDTFLDGKVLEGTTRLCEEGERSNLGLVASSHDDRIGIIDLYPADYDLNAKTSELRPRMLDIDPGTPGVTHLEVGRLPVEVAASPSGRIGYTLDQLDRTISVVDLLELEVLESRYHLAATPISFAVAASGELLTIAGVPSTLTIHAGTTCEDGTCVVPEDEPIELILGGTATDVEVTPDGTRAFVTYRDLDLLSVVALNDDGMGPAGCIDRSATPCVTAEVPLTYGCRDGIDNDGDGLTDRDDIQCLSPLGGEAPVAGGPSRALATECNDTTDNDDDGFIDLEDPECIASGGTLETWDDEPVVTACNDGLDNDGDGLIDLEDGACYSGAGRTEKLVPTLGFDAVSVDEGGFLAWVLDTANSQVLLVDAQRLELIDVPRVAEPAYDPFVNRLGMAVPPSPISIEARVNGINGEYYFGGVYQGAEPNFFRATFSAYVGVDNGQAYNVVAARTYCDSDSVDCLLFPEFPLQSETPTCGFPECTCEEDDASCECPTQEFLESHMRCGAEGARVFVNPVFDIANASNNQARIVGFGQCEIPGELVDELNTYALQNPGTPNNPAACDSELLPQPRVTSAPVITEETTASQIDLDGLGRAGVVTRDESFFTADLRNPRFVTEAWSARVRNQTWSVAYEGVLPRTRRSDWVLPTEVGTSIIDGAEVETITLAASTDLCAAGVEVGDIFVLTTDPLERNGCDDLASEDDFHRSYEIVASDAFSITLAAISGRSPLATRAAVGEDGCYDSGVSGEIRPTDTWVVSGERSGFLSSTVNRNGLCVAGRISESADGRVLPGETYDGPSINFRMYEGFVAPQRGLTFEFDSESGFVSDRVRLGPDNTDTVGLLPYDLTFREADDGDDVEYLISTDPDSNYIFVRVLAPGVRDEVGRTLLTVTELLD